MTVAALSSQLTQEEMVGWAAYYALKAEQEEKSMERHQVSRGARSMMAR